MASSSSSSPAETQEAPQQQQGGAAAAAEACKRAVKGYTDGFPDLAPPIAAPEVMALLRRTQEQQKEVGVVLVDVRTEGEMAVSMLPGALTRAEFEARIDEFRAKPQQENGRGGGPLIIVPYCTMGRRSGLYGRKLMQGLGFEKERVRNGEGIVPWTHDGGTLVARVPTKGEGDDGKGFEEVETTRVHTYGQAWSHLPAAGFEAVYYPPANPFQRCWAALFPRRKQRG